MNYQPSRKKALKKMERLANKYNQDIDLFKYSCLHMIDNLANAFLDDSEMAVETAFLKSFTDFNSEDEKYILEYHTDILGAELKHLHKKTKNTNYIKNVIGL